MKRKMRDVFDSLSPLDSRYWDPDVAMYLSANATTRFRLQAELALVTVLNRRGICSDAVVAEVRLACSKVTAKDVDIEEKRIRHEIRALVNSIRAKVSKSTKPYVHMTATSYDIVDPATAAQYKQVVQNVLVPNLIKLEGVLIDLALREAETVQIGRTHGQHAVPITFGFAISSYISRIGNSIEVLKTLADELQGKFSGAVGAYNASSLFFEDPEAFEAEVLAELGVSAAEQSTQIVPPEALTRLLCEVTIVAGILANLADDMRHLQRTEIGEVGEEFGVDQVGSSTMVQKRNPISFENVKSLWKVVMPRILTVFMDQISEHQRDLTNSASARTYGEVVAYVVYATKRLTGVMAKLKVDRINLARNLALEQGLVVGEPLYIILASLGHPNAHEEVRKMTLQARSEAKPLEEIFRSKRSMRIYSDRMTPYQRQILSNPALYTGIAEKKARAVATRWKGKFGL